MRLRLWLFVAGGVVFIGFYCWVILGSGGNIVHLYQKRHKALQGIEDSR